MLFYSNVYRDELILRSVLLILCDNNRSSENILFVYFVGTCEAVLLTWPCLYLRTAKISELLQRRGFRRPPDEWDGNFSGLLEMVTF